MSTAWYAIRVRSNFEHTTAEYLRAHDYDTFLPTYYESRNCLTVSNKSRDRYLADMCSATWISKGDNSLCVHLGS